MRRLFLTTTYKRDVKRIKRQQKPLNSLGDVVRELLEGVTLPVQYRDHALKGKWKGCRELHIEGDWLLIYHIEDDTAFLDRTGSHAELFSL